VTCLAEHFDAAIRAATTQQSLRSFVEIRPESPGFTSFAALERMVGINVVKQDDPAVREQPTIVFKVPFHPFISVITVNKNQVETVTIGTDLIPHLVGLRIPLEEAPLVTEHEVVNSWSQIAYIDRDLFAGGKPRHAKESRSSPTSYLKHVVRGEATYPISKIHEFLVNLQDLTFLDQELLRTIARKGLWVGRVIGFDR
jgi:hypothetical protein